MLGLQYCKLDLHVHTPASRCYARKEDSAADIVQAALDQQLCAIAITDHNTAAWIARVQGAAAKTSVTVFPGVEITSSEGYHVVALFDPSAKQALVENLLGAVGIQPDDFARSETQSRKQLSEICGLIHDRGGLAVLAHIDAPKGVFREAVTIKPNGTPRVPHACSTLFNSADYDAVESLSGALPAGYDAEHHFTRFPACYQASDNPDPQNPTRHSLDGIGSKYTYFKLQSVDKEGLRQCFEDAAVRIVLPEDLPSSRYPRIVRMTVGPGGFLGNEVIDFHPGLNSIIGGKGVGKSLVVEFLRFGLGQSSAIPDLGDDHARKLDARLGCGNHVDIEYETADGSRYLVHTGLNSVDRNGEHRVARSTTQCTSITSGHVYNGEVSQLLPILAYSQSEVIRIAEDKGAQLNLVDMFIDTSSFEGRLAELESLLQSKDHQFAKAVQARDQIESLVRDVATLDEQIQSLDRQLKAPQLDNMKASEGKKSLLEAGMDCAREFLGLAATWRTQAESLGIPTVPEALTSDSDLIKQRASIERARTDVLSALDSLSSTLKVHVEASEAVIADWLPEYRETEQAYQEYLATMDGSEKGLEQTRARLNAQRETVSRRVSDLSAAAAGLDSLDEARRALLDELEQTHQALFERRCAKYVELSQQTGGKLRLALAHAEDRHAYAEQLSRLLRGGANAPSSSDRDKLSDAVVPRRLVELALQRNADQLAQESGLSLLWARRVIERLWAADDFEAVLGMPHQCYPGDVPSIMYNKGGGRFDELANLSVGQKCTALLIIALCDGTMPIIIDQPEDALDIVSIWEDIAVKLRRNKNERQFILTTHNSSVAVASDSDQFIVLEAGADHGRTAAQGAIDLADVKEAVVAHLEGGNEAYTLRAAKYNLEKKRAG